MLELCTKDLHFSFNGKMFKQAASAAMGSPLGPVIANIFMLELEGKLAPQLSDKMSVWLRFVDNSFSTSDFRKPTDTNVYLHWKTHAPKAWKIGTLMGLFRPISSFDENLRNEIQFLKEVFAKINKYPKAVIEKYLKIWQEKNRWRKYTCIYRCRTGHHRYGGSFRKHRCGLR